MTGEYRDTGGVHRTQNYTNEGQAPKYLIKKDMRMSEKKHIILTNMDTDLWKKFKGVCYTNGSSMNQVVSQLIEQYIQRKS